MRVDSADRPAPVGVDAEDAGQLGEHAGLLERLPDRALTGSLAELLLADRDRPLAGIAAPLQQHPAGVGRTNRRNAGPVLRLQRFRAAHPDVVIAEGGFGT